jgi:radical SAM protein with 4Fe4S-binding SPASM domain
MNEALTDFIASPRCIYIEICSECNLRCEICANDHRYGSSTAGARLSRQDIRNLLAQMPELPLKVILTGGEPLLHPELIDILSDLSGAGIFHAIYTNACAPISSQLMQALKEDSHLAHFTISLHSACEEEHDRMTGFRGSFKKTSENIVRLQQTGVPVVVNSVLTQQTPSDILGTIRYILDLGACMAGLTKYVRPEEEQLNHSLTTPTTERLQNTIGMIRAEGLEELAEVDCCHGCETGMDFHEPCYSARAFCAVRPDGIVTPCIFSSYELGNVRNEDFTSIWTSEKAAAWRERISPTCADCEKLDQCLAGCRIMDTSPGFQEKIDEDKPAEEIRLYKHLSITPEFDWQRGHSGVFLFQGRHARHLPATDIPLLEAMDTQITLDDVSRDFGSGALNTVYDLYQDHMLSLK